MRFLSAQALLSLMLVCTLTSVTASSPAIGLATANGNFQVNSSRVWGNATLFDGTVIETAKAASLVRLNNGAQMRLATESRAKVYQGRLVLEKGSAQLESSAAYPVEARSLKVYAAAPHSVARLQLARDNQVLVAAVTGAVQVANASGVVVANLAAGRALSFDPQAGAAGPAKVSGCLLSKDGKLIVVDQTTNVTVEVQGPGLGQEVGNRVEITGAADAAQPSVAGASQLINVKDVKRIAKGGCSSKAAAAGAGAAGGAAAAAGLTTAGTVAIVGGVAAAATVGGLAAAGTFSGEETRPSTSR